MTTATPQEGHINELRTVLMAQLHALRAAEPEKLSDEIRRAKAVSEVAQTIVNSARVQVDYINALGGASDAPFLHDDIEDSPRPVRQQSALPAPSDVDRLGGPSASHPWRGRAITKRKS
jgi:hypothetical protein